MNYIGSKNKLLSFLSSTILEFVGGEIENLTDLFAGTGIVGQHFKKMGAEILSNDLQYYSYVINRHFIENNEEYSFDGLTLDSAQGSLFDSKISQVTAYLNALDGEEGFIYNNYSIGGHSERNYFSDYNAKKCDAMRCKIESWYINKRITDAEYYYLLASLLESVDRVANTASVYGAYLKSLKKTALKPLLLEPLPTIVSDKPNRVVNSDANSIIGDIEGQVLYLDPPYNQRQYSTNYHMLETIAKYDSPEIYGKTGLRDYTNQKSLYCQKSKAIEAFEDLIERARFDYIFLSYNNEGIIPIERIEKILKSKGRYHVEEKRYSRFKADNSRDYSNNHTIEYLHCVECR